MLDKRRQRIMIMIDAASSNENEYKNKYESKLLIVFDNVSSKN